MRQWISMLLVAALYGAAAHAQSPDGMVLPLRVVEGRMLVIGFIANAGGDVNDISLELSLEDPGVMTLDPDQHNWLDDSAVVKLLVKPQTQFEFPGEVVKAETRPERTSFRENMTKIYSKKLDEHKVAGALGSGFLRQYRVALDVAAGTLTLYPLAGGAVSGDIVSRFELRNGCIWMPMKYADERTGQMMLGSDRYFTSIDAVLARSLGKAAGDVSPLWLGGRNPVDIGSLIALRPQAHEGLSAGATVVAGVNLFEHFRVEVDWSNSMVAFTSSGPRPYPQAARMFFEAEAAGTPEAMEAFLERHSAEPMLGPMAGYQLMEKRRADAETSDEDYKRAFHWVAETSFTERRMENCAIYVKQLRYAPGREALVAWAGTFALQYSRGAITVQDTYRLHNIIGEAYLSQGKVQEAWKHFLSAAFAPLDARTDGAHNFEVNLNLARSYDRMGRAGRAYSRYLRAQQFLVSIKDWLDGIPDEAEIDPVEKRDVMKLKSALAEVGLAIERLEQQIPAEELEMLRSS